MHDFAEGIYEKVRTLDLDRAIERMEPQLEAEFSDVDAAEAPAVLARHVSHAIRRVITNESDADERVEIINEVLRLVQVPDEQLPGTIEQLVALVNPLIPRPRAVTRPVTPLSQAALLTNAVDEPSLSTELRLNWAAPTASICSAHSSAGMASACWKGRSPKCASAASRFVSSRRPTSGPPSAGQ